LATPWTQGDNWRVRLIAGPAVPLPNKAHFLAGIEIVMADGWKTYWRVPGDAGVPPTFDWAGSSNVAAAKVLYPAPSRMPEGEFETIGYKGTVLFPVEVTPQAAGKPVTLRLSLSFGVCRDICIPAEASLSLTSPGAGGPATPAPIAEALERVPRAQANRRSTDPQLEGVLADLKGARPRLDVSASFPGGTEGADLFIEAPDGLYVPLPKKASAQGRERVKFEVDLGSSALADELKGKTLRFTLVGNRGAAEATWTMP
jgi:DsbC/DsbD-like thiol-disulfide interchange protein